MVIEKNLIRIFRDWNSFREPGNQNSYFEFNTVLQAHQSFQKYEYNRDFESSIKIQLNSILVVKVVVSQTKELKLKSTQNISIHHHYMKFPTCAFRSFTSCSSKVSFLLRSWRSKKEMATSKQPPDESYYDSSSCQSSSSIDVLFRSFSSKKEDTNVKNLVVPEISGYYDHDGTGNRFIHQRSSSDDNGDIDISMLSSSSTTPFKLITNKTAVSLPPSAKKRSASFSLPLEMKKHIHDYAFVSGKQYLGLSTLVLLLLAFTNISHIAEAKGEVDTLHQSNHNEKKLNYFERWD